MEPSLAAELTAHHSKRNDFPGSCRSREPWAAGVAYLRPGFAITTRPSDRQS